MASYIFTKSPISLDRLTKEIRDSAITIALDHINYTAGDAEIFFRAELSNDEQTLLNSLISAHDGTPLPQNVIQEVVTQFEKDDKILKLARGSAECNGSGVAVIEVKVPGTFSGLSPLTADGRFVDAGRIWFDTAHAGDYVEKVEVVDKDNKLGYGAGLVIGKWHDDEAETGNEGWWIPTTTSGVSVDSMGGYGFVPSEMYLRITAKKGSGQTSGIVRLNLKWGKAE